MKDTEQDFAAYIGIDWADAKHDVSLQAAGTDKVEHRILRHTPEAIDEWARNLRERFAGRRIAVCLELAKGPIVSALQKYDFLIIFPVNPSALAKYREAWSPSGKKDDPSDSALALEIVIKHRDKLNMLRPQSSQMRALQQLVEDRRKLVDDRVRVTNRITAALKAYFPQVLQWFTDRSTNVFCDFVERWPSPEQAKSARVETLRTFFVEHNVRYATRVAERIQAIKSVVALTQDAGVVLPAKLRVQVLLAQLRPLLRAIEQYDAQIAELCNDIADYRIFASLPGAAEAFAPRLLAAFGEDLKIANASAEPASFNATPASRP
jgi:transposase